MAEIGEKLSQPEQGWRRYDDSEKDSISYIGDWKERTNVAGDWDYKSTNHYTTSAGNKAVFRFIGTKLRLIAQVYSDSSNNIKVLIDKKEYNYSAYGGTNKAKILLFELNGLKKGVHSVEIISTTSGWTEVDAIDIDEDGRLLLQNELLYKLLFEHLAAFYIYNETEDEMQSLGIIPGEERRALIEKKGLENAPSKVLNKLKESAINNSKIVISKYH